MTVKLSEVEKGGSLRSVQSEQLHSSEKHLLFHQPASCHPISNPRDCRLSLLPSRLSDQPSQLSSQPAAATLSLALLIVNPRYLLPSRYA